MTVLSVLALAAVAAGVALLTAGDEEPAVQSTDEVTAGAEPIGPEASIDIGAGPAGVAAGGPGVWATSRDAGQVHLIDPGSNRLDGGPVDVPGARSLAAGRGAVWVVADAGLVRLDLGRGGRTTIEGPVAPLDVTVDDDHVWVTDDAVPGRDEPGPGRLLRLDPVSGAVTGEAPVGLDPREVSAGEGFVWVANAEDGTVTKVDPGSVKPVGRPIAAGARPTNIAAGAGFVWVTDITNAELLRIDPDGERVVGEPVETGPRPRGVAVGAGSVWVASGQLGQVWEFDPASGERVGVIRRTGADPADIAVGQGGVWTADSAGGTVSRNAP